MMNEEGNYDFIVGFTIFMKSEYKTMHRHFSSLERAQRFANNVNIKDNHKIYVDYDLYQKEKEKNKELTDEYMIQKYLINPDFLKDYISKDKIRKIIKEINNKGFNNEINYSEFYYKTEVLKKLLEENNGK